MGDLKYALRYFARRIGAATAVFSVVSSLVLHAVPYPRGDRVVVVSRRSISCRS